ncbi:MAG: (2Fe-2S)-binding protein [Candidatus Obscuribacterales bacterium]|jgi:bacterioferritin-associated ferredoxin
MYICICNAVNETAIRKAVNDGITTWKELCKSLKVATQCGTCAIDAKAFFEKTLAEKLAGNG